MDGNNQVRLAVQEFEDRTKPMYGITQSQISEVDPRAQFDRNMARKEYNQALSHYDMAKIDDKLENGHTSN